MLDIPRLELLMRAETARMCGHEERQGELHMSMLYKEEWDILALLRNGWHATEEEKQKLFQGTWSEQGILNRLRGVCEKEGWTLQTGVKLEAFGGMVIGHPDAVINGHVLVEIKTVPNVDAMEKTLRDNKVPFKVFGQMQAYMFYGKYVTGIAIYEERATGLERIVEVPVDRAFQERMNTKAEKIVQMLRRVK